MGMSLDYIRRHENSNKLKHFLRFFRINTKPYFETTAFFTMYFFPRVKKYFYHISLAPKILSAAILFFLFFGNPGSSFAQKKNVFQTGERLTYKVKFGFVKLGTLIIETGESLGGSQIKTRMKFWTADVPFLNSKDVVDDVIDTTGICLIRFEEHGHDGEKKLSR